MRAAFLSSCNLKIRHVRVQGRNRLGLRRTACAVSHGRLRYDVLSRRHGSRRTPCRPKADKYQVRMAEGGMAPPAVLERFRPLPREARIRLSR